MKFKAGDRVIKINSIASDTSSNGWIGTIESVDDDFYVNVRFDKKKDLLSPRESQLAFYKENVIDIECEKLHDKKVEGWGF